ncbi:MAG: SUMF1/EgtB/PvdO family nonheme iron enzyme [Thermoguttaceae bacterium]
MRDNLEIFLHQPAGGTGLASGTRAGDFVESPFACSANKAYGGNPYYTSRKIPFQDGKLIQKRSLSGDLKMRKFLSAVNILSLLLLVVVPAQAITIDMVTVGNPGNAPDTVVMNDGTTGYGEVDYTYQIGKFEITAGQYTAFLNAVARTADPYSLDSIGMGNTSDAWRGCNIQRSGPQGNYTYSVAADWANRPVNYVSWGSAARFCNWLANGQPNTGVEDNTTTEDGSYYLNGARGDEALMAITRKSTATWVIPNENEWYKAAYHKNDGVTGNYWLYPTGTNDLPSNILTTPDPGNNANFFTQNGGLTIGGPYYRTPVGAFVNSESPYGTFDQGGNVWEWNETSWRGGAFDSVDVFLAASFRSYPIARGGAGYENGFRVAYVPEPSSMVLLFSAAIIFIVFRGKYRMK